MTTLVSIIAPLLVLMSMTPTGFHLRYCIRIKEVMRIRIQRAMKEKNIGCSKQSVYTNIFNANLPTGIVGIDGIG